MAKSRLRRKSKKKSSFLARVGSKSPKELLSTKAAREKLVWQAGTYLDSLGAELHPRELLIQSVQLARVSKQPPNFEEGCRLISRLREAFGLFALGVESALQA
eukprot:6198580-Pleurochrysis_carterae.AAC.3